MQLTKNFTLSEFVNSQTASKNNIDNSIPEVLIPSIKVVAEYLQLIRDSIGVPIVVTSGYRSSKLNKLVGGTANSAHTRGEAADFFSPGLSLKSLYNKIVAMEKAKLFPPFDQLIFEGTWIHIGLTEPRRRQTLLKTAKGYQKIDHI